jgi:hypothetical protein
MCYCVALLEALSFGISFIEIRQEIKLLEHFGNIKDHPVYLHNIVVYLTSSSINWALYGMSGS